MESKESDISRIDFQLDVEQKRYDSLSQSYTEAKNRRLLLLSAETAIFTFLFSDLQNLVPKELYGIIFFSIGVLSGVASLVLSFYHCRPMPWPDPIGPVEDAKMNAASTEREWKIVALNDYKDANLECNRLLGIYAQTLKWSLIFFMMGITILLIIKFF